MRGYLDIQAHSANTFICSLRRNVIDGRACNENNRSPARFHSAHDVDAHLFYLEIHRR